jgi:ferric iron reductase protein FhuF
VNVALVPAALKSILELYENKFLSETEIYEEAKKIYSIWKENSWRFFTIEIPNQNAKNSIQRYCEELKINSTDSLIELGDQNVSFNTLAITENKTGIKVMHSDESFLLIFNSPSEMDLKKILTMLIQRFPVGLLIPDIGVSISNPCYSESENVRNNFKNVHYHGTVIWSWQQALLTMGIQRQLKRNDISQEIRTLLKKAEDSMWKVIDSTRKISQHELWSFKIDQGKFMYTPFSDVSNSEAESNALQLWSTVYLSVKKKIDKKDLPNNTDRSSIFDQ